MSGFLSFLTGGNIKVVANRIADNFLDASRNYPLAYNKITMDMAANARNSKNSHYIQLVIDNKIKNFGELACLFLNTFIAPKNTPFRHTTGDFEEEVQRYLKNKGVPEKYISGDNTHLTDQNINFFPDLSKDEALIGAENIKKKLMEFLKSKDAENAILAAMQITCLTESRLGPQNIKTADSYADIGYAIREAGDAIKAKYWFEASKNIFLRQSDYGKVVDRMCDLANLKSERGEIKSATLALEEAIEYSKKTLGVGHPKANYPRELILAINSDNWGKVTEKVVPNPRELHNNKIDEISQKKYLECFDTVIAIAKLCIERRYTPLKISVCVESALGALLASDGWESRFAVCHIKFMDDGSGENMMRCSESNVEPTLEEAMEVYSKYKIQFSEGSTIEINDTIVKKHLSQGKAPPLAIKSLAEELTNLLFLSFKDKKIQKEKFNVRYENYPNKR